MKYSIEGEIDFYAELNSLSNDVNIDKDAGDSDANNTCNAINENTTSNKRATVLSIRSFIIRISFATCAPILGYIAENYALANSFYVLALVVGVFSLIASFRLSSLD